MEAWFRTLWQKVKKPLEVFCIIIVCILVIVLLVVIALAYIFNVYVPGLRGKTLWDWLQLLIIPVVLAVGGYLFNLTVSRNEQEATKQRAQSEREAAEKRAETERDITTDNQQETALQAYLDSMSELLLHENLRNSETKDEVRKIARVRTLTALPRLDPKRKGSVLRFLIESNLINNEETIIDLHGADLSGVHLIKVYMGEINLHETNLSKAYLKDVILLGANLSKADMSEANLTGTALFMANLHRANLFAAELRKADLGKADLSEANLQETDLIKADMSEANLCKADLFRASITQEQLDKAKSLKGATMPDGSKYP